MDPIPVHLAVEDSLSEAVLRRILKGSERQYEVGTCYRKGGYGYLKRNIVGFNNAAKGTPFVVLTDLDRATCAPNLIRQWLPVPRHPNLLLRIAVREVEAWLLADRGGFSDFLGIGEDRIPRDADGIPDPKVCLINLARRSRRRSLRDAIVPAEGITARQGPNYDGALTPFVLDSWDLAAAASRSPSLRRTVEAARRFVPQWSRR